MILRGGHSERIGDGAGPGAVLERDVWPWVGITECTLWFDQPQVEWPVVTELLRDVVVKFSDGRNGRPLEEALEVECNEGVVTAVYSTCGWSPPTLHPSRLIHCGRCVGRHPLGLFYRCYDIPGLTMEIGMIHEHRLYDEVAR